jgi:hypothetical protein
MMLAYFMMLLVMTYEGGLVICVITGLACGHFIFSVLLSPARAATAVSGGLASLEPEGGGGHNSPCCGGADLDDEPGEAAAEKMKLLN